MNHGDYFFLGQGNRAQPQSGEWAAIAGGWVIMY